MLVLKPKPTPHQHRHPMNAQIEPDRSETVTRPSAFIKQSHTVTHSHLNSYTDAATVITAAVLVTSLLNIDVPKYRTHAKIQNSSI